MRGVQSVRASARYGRAIAAVADLLTRLKVDFIFVGSVARSAWLGSRVERGSLDLIALLGPEQKNQVEMVAFLRAVYTLQRGVDSLDPSWRDLVRQALCQMDAGSRQKIDDFNRSMREVLDQCTREAPSSQEPDSANQDPAKPAVTTGILSRGGVRPRAAAAATDRIVREARDEHDRVHARCLGPDAHQERASGAEAKTWLPGPRPTGRSCASSPSRFRSLQGGLCKERTRTEPRKWRHPTARA